MPEKTAVHGRRRAKVAGRAAVDTTSPPLMGAEDFSFMLESGPGAYIFLGNGDTAGVHHPAYDFNDEASPYGVSLWAKIIETGMPAALRACPLHSAAEALGREELDRHRGLAALGDVRDDAARDRAGGQPDMAVAEGEDQVRVARRATDDGQAVRRRGA